MKKVILKIIEQIIYRFSEKTPPAVKKSERNILVATAALAVTDLINFFNNQKS